MTPKVYCYNNINISWYQTGEVMNGKPLLILHGWGSNSGVMKPLADKFIDVRNSFLIDFPGFGNSQEPDRPWSVHDYAVAIKEFVQKQFQNPDQKIDLLVHSFGGRVAIKLLTDMEIKDRFDKVIFTGAAGLKPQRSLGFYLRKVTAKTLKFPFLLLPEPLRSKQLDKLRQTRIWKMLGSSDYKQLSGVMRETFVKTVTEYLDTAIPDISHEILLIWGENDTSTPVSQGIRMDQLLQKSALVTIKNAGHYAFLDQPAQFASIARAYLEP